MLHPPLFELHALCEYQDNTAQQHTHVYMYTCLTFFREFGVDAELLSRAQIKRKFPWLNVDDIELGSYGKL